MAGSSLLTLIDDIATILDDVAVMTKVAAKKTAGVLGDDLALNAQQVAGVAADRELPVVFAVARGSAVNKLILVPSALLISAVAPWAVLPLLMLGGIFLCYEGCEKLVHKLLHSRSEDAIEHARLLEAVTDENIDLVALEKQKIRGAIRTDFVLSAEIVVITLGTVATATLARQVLVLSGIAVIMTIGVYGLVAGIVKLDDLGCRLCGRTAPGGMNRIARSAGRGILRTAPLLMKFLSIAGTAAMFLVGGGIVSHGIPGLSDYLHHAADQAGAIPTAGVIVRPVAGLLLDAVTGIVAGLAALALVSTVTVLVRRIRRH